MKKLVVLALLLMSSVNAHADRVGNGGDGVVCRNDQGKITSIELLDFYEAQTLRGINHDLDKPSLSIDEKVDVALSRLSRFSSSRAKKYKEQIDSFFSDAVMLSDIELEDIPDSAHIAIPKGCKIEQMVVQQTPEFPEDKRYVVNKELWDALDNDNKAGLLLHEVILREVLTPFASIYIKNSISTRYFNSLITSERLDSMDLSAIIDIFGQVPLCSIDIQGVEIRIGNSTEEGDCLKRGRFEKYLIFYDNGGLREAFVVEGSSVNLPIGSIRITNRVTFYENKRIKDVNLYENSALLVKEQVVLFKGSSGGNPLSFYPHGNVNYGYLAKEHNLLKSDGSTVLFGAGAHVLFDPDGFVLGRK